MSKATKPLTYKHLTTLRLDVDSRNSAQIGATPEGRRTIAPVSGGQRDQDFGDGVQFVTGFCRKESVKYSARPSKHLSAEVEGCNGVFEAWFFAVIYNGSDFCFLLADTFPEGR